MRPKYIAFTMTVLDRNGISVAQTPAIAGNLTITGALASGGVATLDVPRRVGIYGGSDESAKTFTVYGTNRFGVTISEAITGPNATTVGGTKNFKTVTRIAVSAATTGAVEAGTYSTADTQVVPVDCYRSKISYDVHLSASASLTYEVQYTLEDVFDRSFDESTAQWYSDLGLKSTASASASDSPIRGIRIQVTNWSSASDYVYWNILTSKV